MASIEADVTGISALTQRCTQAASRLEGVAVASMPGNSFQPSAAVIDAANTEIAAACARFAERMNDNAVAASTAATRIAVTEGSATVAVRSVAA